MKTVQLFPFFLLISRILNNDLIRTVSFESFFPSNQNEKLHFLDNFNQWYAEINYAATVQVAQGKHGLGLYSNKKILAGQDIIKIPLEYCIHPGILQDYDIYYDMIYSKIKNQEDALALFILSEIKNSKKSNFGEYLKNLPQYTLSPIGFMEDLLNLLKIDETYELTKRRINVFKQSFNDLRKLIFSIPVQIKEKFIGKLSFNDYIWARWIIDSRSVTVEGKKYIVPGADFINHEDFEGNDLPASEIPEKWKSQEKYNRPDINSGSFTVYASKDHERINEIMESYGEYSNFYYFNYKGFASLNNTYDCYDLDLSKVFSLSININPFKPFLFKLNINGTNLCVSDHNISLRKLDFLMKIFSINEKENSCLEKLSKVDVKDPSILDTIPCSFYQDQYKAYYNQLKLTLETKISIYNKQLVLPVFDEEHVKNFNTLGLEIIRNIETYL